VSAPSREGFPDLSMTSISMSVAMAVPVECTQRETGSTAHSAVDGALVEP
jgi:hypothetical protein